jgi:hypothetical protein
MDCLGPVLGELCVRRNVLRSSLHSRRKGGLEDSIPTEVRLLPLAGQPREVLVLGGFS